MFKKLLLTLITFSLTILSFNALAKPRPILLNKVTYQITTEKWVTTNTAKVIVAINAALSENQLSAMHQNILTKLQKIAPKAAWHITRFDRRKDKTGLEQLFAQAEARMPASALTNLRNKAKSISKPGETFSIAAIDFTPSLQEKQNATSTLRNEIYTKVNAEIARLNKVYPGQKYFLNAINFSTMMLAAAQRPRMMMMAIKAGGFAEKAESLAVSNKINLSANIILASKMKKCGRKCHPKVMNKENGN